MFVRPVLVALALGCALLSSTLPTQAGTVGHYTVRIETKADPAQVTAVSWTNTSDRLSANLAAYSVGTYALLDSMTWTFKITVCGKTQDVRFNRSMFGVILVISNCTYRFDLVSTPPSG